MGKINTTLLLAKAHYFIYSGMAGLSPYFMTMTEQLGASKAMMGIMYSTLPFIFLFSKPLFGSLADKFQQKKLILLLSLVMMYGGSLATYFIPLPRGELDAVATHLTCDGAGGWTFPCRPGQAPHLTAVSCNFTCRVAALRGDAADRLCAASGLLCPTHDGTGPTTIRDSAELLTYQSEFRTDVIATAADRQNQSTVCRLQRPGDATGATRAPSSMDAASGCRDNVTGTFSCDVRCSGGVAPAAQSSSAGTPGIYELNRELVAMWVCLAVAGIGMSVEWSVGDAVVIGLLKGDEGEFGRQRLWSCLSWAAVSLLTGYLVDHVSEGKPYKDFTPGYLIVLVSGTLHVIIVVLLRVEESEKPEALSRKVAWLFLRGPVVVVALSAFFTGLVTAPIWMSIVVYLLELDAPQILIGVSTAVQSLSEMPFYFFSDWFLSRMGHGYVMTLVLGVLGFRTLMYSLITSPWTVLPIDLTQGITFGLFYSALATYPCRIAPPNLQATLQGILQGIFEGLGVGIGSFISGFVYEHYGAKFMFRVTSGLAFAFMLSIGASQNVMRLGDKRRNHRMTSGQNRAAEGGGGAVSTNNANATL